MRTSGAKRCSRSKSNEIVGTGSKKIIFSNHKKGRTMQHTDGSFLSVDGYFTVVLSHHRDKNRDGEVETWYLVPSLSRDWGKYMVQQGDGGSPPVNVVLFKTPDDASIAFADWMKGEWNHRMHWRNKPDLNYTDVQFVYAKVELLFPEDGEHIENLEHRPCG